MKLKFSQNGNLHADHRLLYEEIQEEFGFNQSRKEKLKTLLIYLRILKSLGSKVVYIVGSFVTKKEFPNDIDICVDITDIDYNKLSQEYPEFLQSKRY